MGYAQKSSMTPLDATEDIRSYGKIVNEVLDHLPATLPRLKRIAGKCIGENPAYHSISDLQLALEKRDSKQLFTIRV